MADGIELARAYVQIVPTTKGIRQELTSSMGGDVEAAGEDSGNRFGEKFKGAVAAAAKVAAAGIGAAAAGVAAITKSSVGAYAEYEQLVGGVETLFTNDMGSAADIVMDNAAKAFSTAGLSANEYMETVTSFSASLLQGLGGDTEAAAKIADSAIVAMSDNANKMGSSMESIQNAYQGFAKQNYTMLDNLKLGYGGTASEMARLINDSGVLGDSIEVTEKTVNDVSFDKIISAIGVMQDRLGISGTTAKEASETIEGSSAAMGAAWQNLIVGMADDSQNMDKLLDNFATTAITYLQGNLIPRIQTAMGGIAQLVQKVAPIIEEQLPVLIETLLPPLITTAGSLLSGIINALPTLMQTLIVVLPTLMTQITDTLMQNLPLLLEVGLQLLVTLANGIAANLPTLLPTIVEVVLNIVTMLIDNVDMLIDAAIEVIMALADGIINSLPILIEKAPEILLKLAEAIIENLPKLLSAAGQIIVKIGEGLVNSFHLLKEKGKELVEKVKSGFMEKIEGAKTWGRDMIQKFIDGILEKWEKLKEKISGVAQSIKNFLGFSEPKEGPLSNFHTYAPDMMELFAKGIKDNEYLITGQIEDSFNLEPVLSDRYRTPGEMAQNRTSSNVFNIYAAEGMDARDIAEKVSMILAEEERKAAAWA